MWNGWASTRVALPLAILWLPFVVGCMRRPPDHVNMIDFPPDSCASRWSAGDIFADPSLLAVAKAVANDDTRQIDRLIAEKVDIDLAGKDGVTPLAWALMLEKKKAFRRLLRQGANPNHMVWGTVSILEIAAGDGTDSQWLQLCLEYKGDPNVVNRLEGLNARQTPIYRAISSRRIRNVALLIAAGADLEHRDHNGDTPLLFGHWDQGYEVAYVLLEAGADFRARNDQGWDVTYMTIRWQLEPSPKDDSWQWREKVLAFLEDHGADFEAAEKLLAKEDPAALLGWQREKQRRGQRKALAMRQAEPKSKP